MTNNHLGVWERCLGVIRDNVPSISFKTWFEPIVPLRIDRITSYNVCYTKLLRKYTFGILAIQAVKTVAI